MDSLDLQTGEPQMGNPRMGNRGARRPLLPYQYVSKLLQTSSQLVREALISCARNGAELKVQVAVFTKYKIIVRDRLQTLELSGPPDLRLELEPQHEEKKKKAKGKLEMQESALPFGLQPTVRDKRRNPRPKRKGKKRNIDSANIWAKKILKIPATTLSTSSESAGDESSCSGSQAQESSGECSGDESSCSGSEAQESSRASDGEESSCSGSEAQESSGECSGDESSCLGSKAQESSRASDGEESSCSGSEAQESSGESCGDESSCLGSETQDSSGCSGDDESNSSSTDAESDVDMGASAVDLPPAVKIQEKKMPEHPDTASSYLPRQTDAHGKIFDHVHLGIWDLDLKSTQRAAKCHFCKSALQIGQYRFLYVDQARKPTRWMHAEDECLQKIPRDRVESSLQRLRELLETSGDVAPGSSSTGSVLPPPRVVVQHAITTLLARLN